MYPSIEFFGITIYTFWFLMVITWALFMWLLQHFSWKQWISKSIFWEHTVIFTIALLLVGRILYLFAEWRNEQFVLKELSNGNVWEFMKLFFTPWHYQFSLVGGVLGFIGVFLYLTREKRKDRPRYLDAMVWAFLSAALLGYIAALLGGQIYGIRYDGPFSIIYTHKLSIVPYHTGVFPLPIIYCIGTALILIFMRSVERKFTEIPAGFIGYIGVGIFSSMIFLGEFLSGSEDMFESYFLLNLNQFWALFGIIFSVIWIYRNIEKKI